MSPIGRTTRPGNHAQDDARSGPNAAHPPQCFHAPNGRRSTTLRQYADPAVGACQRDPPVCVLPKFGGKNHPQTAKCPVSCRQPSPNPLEQVSKPSERLALNRPDRLCRCLSAQALTVPIVGGQNKHILDLASWMRICSCHRKRYGARTGAHDAFFPIPHHGAHGLIHVGCWMHNKRADCGR